MKKLDIAQCKDAQAIGIAQFKALQTANPSNIFEQHKTFICAAFSISDFVSRTAIRYPKDFEELLPSLVDKLNQQQSVYGHEAYFDSLAQVVEKCETETTLHQAIRKFRHITMLEIACLDMFGHTDFKESLKALSTLATSCINQSLSWLHTAARARYGTPEHNQQMLVLGMGKLGAQELNFSSDIDLIFVYPSSGHTNGGRKSIDHASFFTKLAQKLISALHQTTIDGQAFRVDMRLRPLGESGPIVLSMSAFESYYQEQGRDWERFAMQKAKVLNQESHENSDDISTLQSIIKPFVYRKYLDFTTLDSLRKMKRLIETEVLRRNLKNNIKLGKGGIREVEFLVQCHQLIHAGRIIECQTQPVFDALDSLQKHNFLSPSDSQQLADTYAYLRKVEHFLQAINDKQTQSLPDSQLDQQRLAILLEKNSYDAAKSSISEKMFIINQYFTDLISNETDDNKEATSLHGRLMDAWRLDLDAAEFSLLLQDDLKNTDLISVYEILSEQKQKIHKMALPERANSSVAHIVTKLMIHIFSPANPQVNISKDKQLVLFKHLLSLVQSICRRSTYLDLLNEHPQVISRLISLCSKSVWISEQISRFPLLLDELLHPAYLESDTLNIEQWRDQYEDELRLMLLRIEPDDIEEQMNALRYFKITQQMRIALMDISGKLSTAKVSDKLSILAEVILTAVVNIAWEQLASKFGTPQGTSQSNKHFAIIAYGKMGGWEMGYGSDIDMVCLHDVSLSSSTEGQKSLSATEFYVKLVQKISHIFSTKTYLGELYEMDLRLRPSGNSGLLVSHIDSFNDYQLNEAWTWEHQALTRSRCVFGSKDLNQAFTKIRKRVLTKERSESDLQKEVRDMRNKMREHLDKTTQNALDLKQMEGGITDLEFLTQYLVLNFSHKYPTLSEWSDNLRILDSLKTTKIISESCIEDLQTGYIGLRDHMHKMSLDARKLAIPNEDIQKYRDTINTQFVHFLDA